MVALRQTNTSAACASRLNRLLLMIVPPQTIVAWRDRCAVSRQTTHRGSDISAKASEATGPGAGRHWTFMVTTYCAGSRASDARIVASGSEPTYWPRVL